MAGVTRAGTLQTQSFILEQINKNNAKYVGLSEQITTGQKTQRYSGIADQSALTVNLANSEDMLNQYIKSADTAVSRLSAQHAGVSTVIDVLTDFRAQLLQAMTAEQSDEGRIGTVAEGHLSQIEATFNSDLGGVYLFGGVKNDVPPVDLSDPINNGDGTYYTGASQLMQARVDSNTVVQYGVTADFDGFKDMIRGIQRVASASASLTELETALDEINSALTQVTQLEAELGHQMKVVERSQERNTSVKVTVINQLSGLRDADISAVMVELTQRQTILQASYSVIAKQNDLSLLTYIR